MLSGVYKYPANKWRFRFVPFGGNLHQHQVRSLTKRRLSERCRLLGVSMVQNKVIAKFYSSTIFPGGNRHFQEAIPGYREPDNCCCRSAWPDPRRIEESDRVFYWYCQQTFQTATFQFLASYLFEQITTALDQIDQVTQSNTASAEESASSAEEFASQAQELLSMIEQFTLEGTKDSGRLLEAPEY